MVPTHQQVIGASKGYVGPYSLEIMVRSEVRWAIKYMFLNKENVNKKYQMKNSYCFHFGSWKQ